MDKKNPQFSEMEQVPSQFTPAFFLCLHSLIAWNRLTSFMLPFITPRIWLLSLPSSWYKFQWKINYKNLVLLVGKR